MNLKKEKPTKPEDVPSVIIPAYKPSGMTSFDVIRKLKKVLPRKTKIGHFGTLDPFADGVLLIGLGKSLKFTDLIHQNLEKSYEATGVLGQKMNTGDLTGEIISESKADFNQEIIEKAISEFNGVEYFQVPPSFSATKHEGKKLYELARDGIMIKKDPVKRKVYAASFLDLKENEVRFSCRVSTGTYIRTLFEDIAEKFSQVGFLKTLTRSELGRISLDDCCEVDELQEKIANGDFSFGKNPWETIEYPKLILADESQKRAFSYGQKIRLSEPLVGKHWVYFEEQCLGLADAKDLELSILINLSAV